MYFGLSQAPVVTGCPAFAGHDKPGIWRHLILPLMAVLGLLCSSAYAQDPTPDQIDQGRQTYDDLCATCHGRDMVSPGLVTFDLRKFPKDDAARFRNSVLNGKGAAMPPWQGKVSDEELNLLWAYVRGGP
jgi:mono/diheme cytochrome c family protein